MPTRTDEHPARIQMDLRENQSVYSHILGLSSFSDKKTFPKIFLNKTLGVSETITQLLKKTFGSGMIKDKVLENNKLHFCRSVSIGIQRASLRRCSYPLLTFILPVFSKPIRNFLNNNLTLSLIFNFKQLYASSKNKW